jgi:hypothetical protein
MTGPSTSQQSIPGMQHSVPQQNSDPAQALPVHGGVPQVPRLQYGWSPPHLTPQAPQLLMSSVGSTHMPLQHVDPGLQVPPHFPPLLELDVLPVVLEVVIVPELEVDVGPEDVLLVVVVLEDFEPPVPALAPPLPVD